MKIGIVSHWFNRGQATVARQIRSIFDEAGHEAFILARPTQHNFFRKNYIAEDDVWTRNGVTHAEAFLISRDTYLNWARDTGVEVVFFDQNYQFEEIAALKSLGIKTIGRFVWEAFSDRQVAGAKEAFSTIYSLTHAEQARYQTMGIESPYVQYGCHPELLGAEPNACTEGPIRYFYIGGYLSHRKPTGIVLEAFRTLGNVQVELTCKTQRPPRYTDLFRPRTLSDLDIRPWHRLIDTLWRAPRIPGVTFNPVDLPSADYHRLFREHHVTVAPSRWEGLGLHLFESLGFGMPTIGMDIPPVNEVFTDGFDALLVESRQIGFAPSGIPAYEPDGKALLAAFRELSNPERLSEMSRNVRATLERRNWGITAQGYLKLLAY